LFVSKLDTIK